MQTEFAIPTFDPRWAIKCMFLVTDPRTWILTEDFKMDFYLEGEHTKLTVPAGFKWDGASVPRCFQNVFPKWGRYAVASLVHDWLYDQRIGTRERADKAFLHLMGEAGVNWLGRHLMFLAVRLGGWRAWKDDK